MFKNPNKAKKSENPKKKKPDWVRSKTFFFAKPGKTYLPIWLLVKELLGAPVASALHLAQLSILPLVHRYRPTK